jgi:DNA cross-link repair 1A protein
MTGTVNPYTKESTWHGDANALLELTNSTTAAQCTSSHAIDASVTASKQTSLTSFFKMPARNLNNVLMAASRRQSKEQQIISAQKMKRSMEGSGRKRKWQRTDYSQFECPHYKKISGTDFVVDGFHYAKESLTKNYFLTHFHADHYGGISSTWSAGTIYCSLPTANLVNQQLGVNKKYLHPLPLNTPTVIESQGKPITVTLMNANHCPGAVMFLFENAKEKILHVGDFRWSREVMLQNSHLREIARQELQLDVLYLDTTYCDSKYILPSQNETVQAVIGIFKKENKTSNGRTLHLFGAYTIGKEKMYFSVAESFGLKVYIDTARHRILSALDLPKEQMQRLTTRKEESSIWVVPMGHINMQNLPNYFASCNNKPFAAAYDRIVAYRPTGWSLSSKPAGGLVTTRTKGNITIHSIPYSEHSSFPELVDCIACLQPGTIIPTVNASKSQEQITTLLKALRTNQQEFIMNS